MFIVSEISVSYVCNVILMFLVQYIQSGRSYTAEKKRWRYDLVIYLFCPRQRTVTDPGQWKEQLYPLPGTWAEPGVVTGGLDHHELNFGHFNHLRKLYFKQYKN